jgi:CHAD domain-containing protein
MLAPCLSRPRGAVTQQSRLDKPGTETVRRIVRREAKKALDDLPSSGQPKDAVVHHARKRIKRARAALRLVRKPLGERRYNRENRELRDAARPLSAVRDAKVLVEAFDGLVGPSLRSDGMALRTVRDVLIRHQLRVRRRLLGGKGPLKPTRSGLQSVRRRALRWPMGRRSWPALGAGVDRVYRAGRKQLAKARRRPSDENLHELRKQTKYLWHQLKILEPIAPSRILAMVRRAHDLADLLGEDHDLAVLRLRLTRSNGQAPRSAIRSVFRLIRRARQQRRTKALEVAQRVYAEKPKHLSDRLQDQWRAWRKKRAAGASRHGRPSVRRNGD